MAWKKISLKYLLIGGLMSRLVKKFLFYNKSPWNFLEHQLKLDSLIFIQCFYIE